MGERLLGEVTFRDAPQPLPDLPLGARSVGRRIVDGRFTEGPRRPRLTGPRPRRFLQLLWGIRGAGEVVIGDDRYRLEPEMVCVYLPADRHHFWSVSALWEFRWLTVDGPELERIWTSLGAAQRPRRVGPCPVSDFEQLKQELLDAAPATLRCAGATALRILFRATAPAASDRHPIVARAEALLRAHLGDPDFTVGRLAQLLRRNRSTLARTYRAARGTTLAGQLQRLRLQRAQALLATTSLGVAAVARECGFADPDYFSRAFKRHLGLTPTAFRREN